MKKISVLVIEDNRLLREGIALLIKQQADMAVAELCSNARDIKKIHAAKPQVVLLDIGLRNQNSINVVKTLFKILPEIKIILMDLVPLEQDIIEYIKAGVTGFILKDASATEFLKTIRVVSEGTKVLPPNLTGSLFSQIVANAVKKNPLIIKESVSMTKREKQVIELIADGLTNKEIALKLHLSPHTVKSHIHNILDKLALHTRVQIAKYSHENYEAIIRDISYLEE